jgi:hypothetical protein
MPKRGRSGSRACKAKAALQREVADTGPARAQQIVTDAEQGRRVEYLAPAATPRDWKAAVDIARRVTIDAARRGATITDGELKLAALRATGKLVGTSTFGELTMAINRKADGVLLSSIVVRRETGKPGAGFTEFARSQGSKASLATLQKRVFKRFERER